MERRDHTFGKRQRRAQPDTEGPPRQDEASLSPTKSVFNEPWFWEPHHRAMAAAWGEAFLLAYAEGEPAERLVTLARWAGSSALDAMDPTGHRKDGWWESLPMLD